MMNNKLAILVPYRNRQEHLEVFVTYMNNYLKSNYDLDFRIVIIEQTDDNEFNRGKLINIGATIATDCNYFILHDIDMLPISADYSYENRVFHLARNVYEQSNSGDIINNYVNELTDYAGGVLKIPRNIYFEVNGFDNDYWGWGSEDDELKFRLISKKHPVLVRTGKSYFITLKHDSNVKNIDNDTAYSINFKKSLLSKDLAEKNELDCSKNGISTLEYELLKSEYYEHYEKYTVKI